MAFTNSTTNYHLPQYVTGDIPTYLVDQNGAWSTIDTNLKSVSDVADAASSTATTADTKATNAATSASGANTKADALTSSIADTYSTTDTYAVGDKVMRNNLLYRCITAVTTPGAFDPAAWERVTVEDLTDANATDIHNIEVALGNTDISTIGDGSVTGAISSINTSVNSIYPSVARLNQIGFSTAAGASVSTTFTIPKGGLYLASITCSPQQNAAGFFSFWVNDVSEKVFGGAQSIVCQSTPTRENVNFTITVDTRSDATDRVVTLNCWAQAVFSCNANVVITRI